MPYPTDCQSNFAHLMFAFELQRKSRAAGWKFASVAACPGVIVSFAVLALS
jgi:hypothetical protein